MRVAWWPHGALIPGWDEVASILRCCCGETWKGENVVAVCNVCNHNILAGAQHSKHSCYQLQPACAPHKKHASKFGQFCIVPSCCRKSSAQLGVLLRQQPGQPHGNGLAPCILSSSAAVPTMSTVEKADFSSSVAVPTMSTPDSSQSGMTLRRKPLVGG